MTVFTLALHDLRTHRGLVLTTWCG